MIQYWSVDLIGDGLAPNRCQSVIWACDDHVHWQMTQIHYKIKENEGNLWVRFMRNDIYVFNIVFTHLQWQLGQYALPRDPVWRDYTLPVKSCTREYPWWPCPPTGSPPVRSSGRRVRGGPHDQRAGNARRSRLVTGCGRKRRWDLEKISVILMLFSSEDDPTNNDKVVSSSCKGRSVIRSPRISCDQEHRKPT